MDTVYGTKKYFQSLSGASDIYRSQACRTVTNDYNYQNTLGRRSTLGAYYHMHKQPSYTNDHSLNSQYSYNTWGIWRDGRNIAPSTFSTKTHTHYQKTRSFSIILTTAAFIVLLAVISIAGLAFYFSSIKTNIEDPVLGFEGSFRIAKGDLFSTGLKYNHTTTYKQKIEFYKRFVERSLTDNGLQPLRTDVWGFGDGPLIKVSFRTFLDVRKLPQNVHSVEEYIKESLFTETTAVKSLYRSLRIDAESVEIKRILDEQVVKSASLFKEAQAVPTSQTQLEKRLMKKGGSNAPSLLSKPPTTTVKPRTTAPTTRPHSIDDEPDIDVENAPVIQGSFEGSFEITKTDADIARKKVTPTKAYTSLPPKAVTPFALRVKPKKPTIEKLTTIIPQHQAAPKSTSTTSTTTTTTTAVPTTTTTSTTTTTTSTTTTTLRPTTMPTTTTQASTTPSSTTTTTTPAPTTTTAAMPAANFQNRFSFPAMTTPGASLTVPKLDANLFTSVPILDTQPWRPIHREVPELVAGPPPAFPTKTLPTLNQLHTTTQQPLYPHDIPQRRVDEIELPFIPENPSPPVPSAYNPYAPGFFGTAMRKPDLNGESSNPQDMLFYHSFGNPVFMPGTDDIERLGAGAHVHPHPLPVPLIDDVVVPPFKPIVPTLGSMDKLPFDIEASNEKFEHIGGGVIVKKHENSSSDFKLNKAETTTKAASAGPTTTTESATLKSNDEASTPPAVKQAPTANSPTVNSELADTIGEFFMDLLNLTKEETNLRLATTAETPLESRIESEEQALPEQAISSEATAFTEAPTVTELPLNKPAKQTADEESLTTTIKPSFMNLKEIILQRNQAVNQTRRPETTTKLQPTSTSTSTTSPESTTIAPSMKRNRIRPTYKKPPTIIDDSSLFPSHSKWEFVNSSSTNNFGHTGNMRKVFNKTLQAWVSEDVEKTENFTLNDIKTRINNATNIQDISLIFDTLASKLGITPSVPVKVPPFSQNKLKHAPRNETKATAAPSTTTIPPTTSTTTTVKITTTPATSTTKHFVELPIQRREPFIKPMASFMEDSSSEGVGAAIPVVGEAEVEVIDPMKYEEMLRSSQFAELSTTAVPPKLVTLLPVRSNSGIRTYRPWEEMQRSSSDAVAESSSGESSIITATGSDSTGRSSIKRKSSNSSGEQGRRMPPAETVVKSGIRVKVK